MRQLKAWKRRRRRLQLKVPSSLLVPSQQEWGFDSSKLSMLQGCMNFDLGGAEVLTLVA